jgi:hypothetical protein
LCFALRTRDEPANTSACFGGATDGRLAIGSRGTLAHAGTRQAHNAVAVI